MNQIHFNFSHHARQRMKEKSVTELEVKQTVLNPDVWYYGDYGEMNAIKDFGIKKIRVPYISSPDEIKIITVILEK